MVTKLVSAKPDELRTHIEEAAGYQSIEKEEEKQNLELKEPEKIYHE